MEQGLIPSGPHLGWGTERLGHQVLSNESKRKCWHMGKVPIWELEAWSFTDLLHDLGPDVASASLPPSVQGEQRTVLPVFIPSLLGSPRFRADNGCEALGLHVTLININDSTRSCLLLPGPGPAASPWEEH